MSSKIINVNHDESEVVPHDPNYLAELEELAKMRYTQEDEEYMKIKMKKASLPPIEPARSFSDRGYGNHNYRAYDGDSSHGGGRRGNSHNYSHNYEQDSQKRFYSN